MNSRSAAIRPTRWISSSRIITSTEDGQVIDRVDDTFRAHLFDLALAAGSYVLSVGPSSGEGRPYDLSAFLTEGPADPEPNDGADTAVPIGDGAVVSGRLARKGDRDLYRLSVPRGEPVLRVVGLMWDGAGERELCLLHDDGQDRFCRSGNGLVELRTLQLEAGDHLLAVRGIANPDDGYVLSVDVSGPVLPDLETEPNDFPQDAGAFDTTQVMRGRGGAMDPDYFVITTVGQPELWQISVTGDAIEQLTWVGPDGGDLGVAALDASGTRADITDLYLIPGEHRLRVRANGDYSITAVSLGAPDPEGEREPNDEVRRAEPYRVGEHRVGRLPQVTDVDRYRLLAAAPEHLRLHLEQAPDADTELVLERGGERLIVERRTNARSTDRP